MKNWMFFTLVLCLVLALTACGSTAAATTTTTTSTRLSLEGQLLVGTFKLENTALAITSTQASSLLPLWETLESLASSNTAASQEVDAVVSQIETTMSTQQVSSITAMKLTQADLAATVVDTGSASTSASSANTAKAGSSQQQPGGPGGNPPSDIGAISGVESIGQTQASSSQPAAKQSTATTQQISAAMIKALVELLQKKIG